MNTTTLNMTTLDGGVIIKKGEGGGSTPPSGESNIEYFVNDESRIATTMADFAHYVKLVALEGEIKYVVPNGPSVSNDIVNLGAKITEFGINLNDRMLACESGHFSDYTVLELLETHQVTRTDIDSLPRITKEQFYSFD